MLEGNVITLVNMLESDTHKRHYDLAHKRQALIVLKPSFNVT